MSKPKPKHTQSAPPSLNAIYRQQLLLRDAVKALTQELNNSHMRNERLMDLLGNTQSRCERAQFDRGVLIERLHKKEILRHIAEPLSKAQEVPTLTERDEDLAAVQSLIDQRGRHPYVTNGAVLAFNTIMALKPIPARQSPQLPTTFESRVYLEEPPR